MPTESSKAKSGSYGCLDPMTVWVKGGCGGLFACGSLQTGAGCTDGVATGNGTWCGSVLCGTSKVFGVSVCQCQPPDLKLQQLARKRMPQEPVQSQSQSPQEPVPERQRDDCTAPTVPPEDMYRNLSVEAQTVLQMNFIAIPKTGSSSIESTVYPRSQVKCQGGSCCDFWRQRPRLYKCCQFGAPWHLAPDVFLKLHSPRLPWADMERPNWCVVRNPADRWRSEDAWFKTVHKRSEVRGELHASQLSSIFANGRFTVMWDETFVHKQPQHWFVWDSIGRVQCHCVVAYEKLGLLTSQHKNVNAHGHSEAPNLPSYLRELYRMDAVLWRLARESTSLCYTPKPLCTNCGTYFSRRHVSNASASANASARMIYERMT